MESAWKPSPDDFHRLLTVRIFWENESGGAMKRLPVGDYISGIATRTVDGGKAKPDSSAV